jgi:hypothetical protein
MRRITTLIMVLAAALACAVAVAATTQSYSQKYTTTHPRQATGMTVRWSARATNGGTPAQPKTVTLTFPKGMGLDPFAVDATAKIGSGTAVFSGTPARPITVYNRRPTGMTLVISNPVGMSVTLQAQYAGMGSQLVIPIPKFKIPPAVLTGMSLTIKGGSTQRPFMRTPRTCPSSKAWKFSAAFVYPAGTPTQMLNSTTACVKH